MAQRKDKKRPLRAIFALVGLLIVFGFAAFNLVGNTGQLQGRIQFNDSDLNDPFDANVIVTRTRVIEFFEFILGTNSQGSGNRLQISVSDLQNNVSEAKEAFDNPAFSPTQKLNTINQVYDDLKSNVDTVQYLEYMFNVQIEQATASLDLFQDEVERLSNVENLPETYYSNWDERVASAQLYLDILTEMRADLRRSKPVIFDAARQVQVLMSTVAEDADMYRFRFNPTSEYSGDQINFFDVRDIALYYPINEITDETYDLDYFFANQQEFSYLDDDVIPDSPATPNIDESNGGYYIVATDDYYEIILDRQIGGVPSQFILEVNAPGHVNTVYSPATFFNAATLQKDSTLATPAEFVMEVGYEVTLSETDNPSNTIDHALVWININPGGDSGFGSAGIDFPCGLVAAGTFSCPIPAGDGDDFSGFAPPSLKVLAQDYEFYEFPLTREYWREKFSDPKVVIDVKVAKLDIEPEPIEVPVETAVCTDIDIMLSDSVIKPEEEPKRVIVSAEVTSDGADFVGSLVLEKNGSEWQNEALDFAASGTGLTRTYQYADDIEIGDEFSARVEGEPDCEEVSITVEEDDSYVPDDTPDQTPVQEEEDEEPVTDFFDNFDCEEPFYDVNEGQWFGNHICFLFNWREVIRGRSATLAEPQANMTRAEFIAVLLRLFELDDRYTGREYFSDNPENSWHHDYVNVAYEEGIISLGDGRVRPNDPIRRGEAAVMLYNLYDALGLIDDDIDTDISDLDDVCEDVPRYHYSAEAFAYLAQLEGELEVNGEKYVVTGDGRSGDCRPDDYMDRASLVVIGLRGLLAVSDPYELMEENPDLFDLID